MKDLKFGRGPPELGRPRSSFRLGQRVPEQPPRTHAQLVDWAHFLSGVEIAVARQCAGAARKATPQGDEHRAQIKIRNLPGIRLLRLPVNEPRRSLGTWALFLVNIFMCANGLYCAAVSLVITPRIGITTAGKRLLANHCLTSFDVATLRDFREPPTAVG
jgi:hypothetical protein